MYIDDNNISLTGIISEFRYRILVTWGIVLVENVLIALIPLLIGFSIDALLDGRFAELWQLGGVLVLLLIIVVVRRVYDTRIYGSIRVALGSKLTRQNPDLEVSAKNARLDMSRELVDFLEVEAPQLLTAMIQIVITLIVLATFDIRLAIASVVVTVGMLAIYGFFHSRFYHLNSVFNEQKEKQVGILRNGVGLGVFRHLRALRNSEVKISDTEAIVYGGIFVLQIVFILYNLQLSAQLPDISAGKIFSIATYSWEYVEAALLLPMSLQSWSRLSEITARINS